MKTYFNRIDFDKDGSITRKDFEGMAQRFADSGKIAGEHKDQLSVTLTAVSTRMRAQQYTRHGAGDFNDVTATVIKKPTTYFVVNFPYFFCMTILVMHSIVKMFWSAKCQA